MALCLICEELYPLKYRRFNTVEKKDSIYDVSYLSSLQQQPLPLGVLFSPESSLVVGVPVHCFEDDWHSACNVLQTFAYAFAPDAWPVPLVL